MAYQILRIGQSELSYCDCTTFWGGRRESNPQLSAPQADALTVELRPPFRELCARRESNPQPNR